METNLTRLEEQFLLPLAVKHGQKPFKSPSMAECILQAAKMGLPQHEAEKFYYFYESKGWVVGRVKMRLWISAMAGWKLRWQEGQYVVNAPRAIGPGQAAAPRDQNVVTQEVCQKALRSIQ